MRVLAGDIGGTKTAIAAVAIDCASLRVLRSREYPSARYSGLSEIVEEFLSGEGSPPRSAAFGVAGPVRGGRAKVTKLPWVLEERRLARDLGLRRVRLLNDFAAAALGLRYLPPRRAVMIVPGEAEPEGPVALIGAGTGLGQAALLRRKGREEPLPSEGGHADFGPRNAREDRLVRFLRKRFGRVTRDRLLSGEGLTHIYAFLVADRFAPERPAVLRAFASPADSGDRKRARKGSRRPDGPGEPRADRAAVISRFGLARRDSLCAEALRMFVAIYGSEAGNLALQYRATGGVYLAGGIAPKILTALKGPEFAEAFRAKAPLEDLLATIPVRVVRERRLPLFGAAAAAYMTAME